MNEQPESLSSDPGKLEVGDLVIGFNDQAPATFYPFGFHIAPEKQIPQGEKLMIHFEIYHLDPPDNQNGHFTVDYVLKTPKGFFDRLFGRRDQVSLTLNFETNKTSFRDNLEIDTSELVPGEYSLEFSVTEPSTGRYKTRKATVRIVE